MVRKGLTMHIRQRVRTRQAALGPGRARTRLSMVFRTRQAVRPGTVREGCDGARAGVEVLQASVVRVLVTPAPLAPLPAVSVRAVPPLPGSLTLRIHHIHHIHHIHRTRRTPRITSRPRKVLPSRGKAGPA
jgi:hypothetical protein